MSQSAVIKAFRNRMKARGYTAITIKRKAAAGIMYHVTAIEPAGNRLIEFDISEMAAAARLTGKRRAR